MRPQFDERDAEILVEIQAGRDHLNTLTSLPRTGDIVILKDGSVRRVTYSWSDASQLTIAGGVDASFATRRNGGMSFSGSLSRSVPNTRFKLTDRKALARCWMFHHDHVAAHNGVNCEVKVRVWETDIDPKEL